MKSGSAYSLRAKLIPSRVSKSADRTRRAIACGVHGVLFVVEVSKDMARNLITDTNGTAKTGNRENGATSAV